MARSKEGSARRAKRFAVAAALGALVGGARGAWDAPPVAAAPGAQPPAAADWTTVLGDFTSLEDIVARGPEDLWAVGDGIVHWDGARWRQTWAGARPQLHAVDGLEDGQLWAVGETAGDPCRRAPVVLHFDGRWWRDEPVESHQPLWDVAMVAADDGWAVGGLERPVILRYDGARWRPFAEPETGPLRAIHLTAPDEGWAVGLDGALVRWDGRDWRAVAPPLGDIDLLDVAMVDADFGWAVGVGLDARAGVVLAWRDGAWRVALLDETPALTAVFAPIRGEALAVGRFGALLRWDGLAWRDVGRTYPGGFVPTAGGRAPSLPSGRGPVAPDASARPVGGALGGPVLRATGAASAGAALDGRPVEDRARRDRALADPHFLRGLGVLTGSEALVAVGDGGQIVVIDRTTWHEVHSGRRLTAIDLLPTGEEGWVVGDGGPPLRWDGQTWLPAPGPYELRWLRAVDAVAPGLAWAVGERGTVARFADGRWSIVPFPSPLDLTAVAFTAPDRGFTFVNGRDSDQGPPYEARIMVWDGARWFETLHLCGVQLVDVAVDPRGGAWFTTFVWATGEYAALLHVAADGRTASWVPIAGARAPGAAPGHPLRLALGAEGGWAVGGGLARLDGASWRSVVDLDASDTVTWAEWMRRMRPTTADAAAAIDRSALWLVASAYDWRADPGRYDDPGGSWLACFAPGAGYDPADPDAAAGRSHRSQVTLHDIAVARAPDGRVEVWAVGDGATILHRRLPPGAGAVPAASATPVAPPTEGWPTPTPHAVVDRDAALAVIDAEIPPRAAIDGTPRPRAARLELVGRAEAARRFEAANENAWRSGGGIWRRGGGGLGTYDTVCPPGWTSWWWVEVDGPTRYDCDAIFGAVDAATGERFELLCTTRVRRVHLPFAFTRGGPVGTPSPVPPPATPRDLTPRAVEPVDGPCPSPTPYPTGSWPYP